MHVDLKSTNAPTLFIDATLCFLVGKLIFFVRLHNGLGLKILLAECCLLTQLLLGDTAYDSVSRQVP